MSDNQSDEALETYRVFSQLRDGTPIEVAQQQRETPTESTSPNASKDS